MSLTLAQFISRAESGRAIKVRNATTIARTIRQPGTTRDVVIPAATASPGYGSWVDLGAYFGAADVEASYELRTWLAAGVIDTEAGTLPLVGARIAGAGKCQKLAWATGEDNPKRFYQGGAGALGIPVNRGFTVRGKVGSPIVKVDQLGVGVAGDYLEAAEAGIEFPYAVDEICVYYGASPTNGDYVLVRFHQ